MKLTIIIVTCVFIGAVLSAPSPQEVQILESENNNDGTGNYNYRYLLSDNTKREETGVLKDLQGEGGTVQAVVQTGSYEFTDLEGNVHRVTYTADENGFHPVVES